MHPELSAAILCGGRSSRMRRPKALLPWAGQPLVVALVQHLRALTDDVIVVNRADLALPDVEARIIIDRAADLGPLGGIREALQHARRDLVLVTSTDQPELPPGLVDTLLQHGPAAAFQVDDIMQPFPGIYARQLAETADQLIESDRMRPLFLLEHAGGTLLDGQRWHGAGAFHGFNTPEAYLDAVRRAGQTDPVQLSFSGAGLDTGILPTEAPAGTLADILGGIDHGELPASHRWHILLNDSVVVDDPLLPIGPGETLHLRLDARPQ